MAVDNGPVTCSELSVNQVGPFSQTMALGCSISSITMNAGWGATASTCNLGLVRDTCKHWRNEAYDAALTFNETILQQDTDQPKGTAFEKNAQGEYTFQADPRRQNQRNIADQQLKEEAYKTNPANQDSNQVYGDFGKQIWYLENGLFKSVNWLDPDLGFPADPTNSFSVAINGNNATEGFDINGVPVFIRMEDLVFGGIIKSWEQRVGQQGGTYNVAIEGMASLLKGCSLIINNYSGSVGTRFNTLFNDIPVATLPSNEPFGDYSDPDYPSNVFNGSVRGGNHPNVINLMGLANYVYGFTGAAWQGSKGVSAADIFVILRSVLSPENTARAESAYFPYGALVGRSLVDRDSGQIPQIDQVVYEKLDYRAFGFMSSKLAVDNRYRPLFALDLSEVPMPPNDLYFTEPSLTITGFLDAISQGGQYDYLVECYPSTNTIYSAVIKIKTVNRSVAVPPNSLRSTVYNATDINNLSYGEEFDTANVRKIILGGPQQRMLQFSTVNKSVYQETRAYDPYKSSYYTTVNNKTKGNGVVVPYLTQMSTTASPRANSYQDSTADVRWYKSYRVGAGVVAQQTTSDQFFQDTNNQPQAIKKKGNYTPLKLGLNYPQSDVPPSAVPEDEDDNIEIQKQPYSYPLCSDLISPYYGQDSTGNIRLVYYDRAMCQIQVMTSMMDWRTWCSYSTPTFAEPSETAKEEEEEEVIGEEENEKPPFTITGNQWIITEYEIRAAMSSLEIFLSWLYDGYAQGFRSMTATYFYNYIAQAFCKDVADKLLKGTTSLVKDLNKADKFGGIDDAAKKLAKESNGATGLTVGAVNDVLTDYRLKLEIQKLQKFIAEDIGQYHSKEYLIRMPQVFSFIDRSGNRVYNYEPAEAGWEEEGNPLDDTMVFGGGYATYLANENGTFPPLLGFLANGEFDNQQRAVTDDDITAMPLPTVCPPKPEVDDEDEGDSDDADDSRDPDGQGGANTPPDKDPVGDADETRPDNSNPEKKGITTGTTDDGSFPNVETNARGWYQPLDIESLDKSESIYFNTVGMVNDRNFFYASLGYSISQNRAPYNGLADAHGEKLRNNSCYRKVYTRAGLREISPKSRVAKQFGFSRMHGGGPCVVITGSNKLDQKSEMGVKFCKTLQKYLLQYRGFQIPRESGFTNQWQSGLTLKDKNGIAISKESLLVDLTAHRQQRGNYVGGLRSGAGGNNEEDNYVFTRGLFAIPVFAAVPVKYNTQNYGPWASVPGTVENEIFNVGNQEFSKILADDMVGGVDVKYDSSAVPWNYGGIEYLDYAKLTEVTQALKAQQSLEKASFSVPGILAANGVPVTIGDFLAGAGPVINSLNASINAQGGFNTNYTLRTYVKKVGFYNNERAKEIAELGKNANTFRNEQAKLQGEISQKPENQAKNTGGSSDTNIGIDQSPVLETSPVEALVGNAAPFIAGGTSMPDMNNFNPSWHLRTSTGGSNTGPEDTYQHISRTTIYKANEFAGKEIKPETYNLTSMMSLDGIISPISFYPSPFGSTFNITKYDRKHCPYCRGQGTYKYDVPQTIEEDSLPNFPVYGMTQDLTITRTAECTFCVDSGEKEKERSASAGLSTIRTPPYIIDRGTDSELANSATAVAGDECQDSRVLINYTTLTPVVMSSSTGEFAVSVNRQDGDLCAHSIRMVGIGWLPPDSSEQQDLFIDNTTNRQKNYSDYDISYTTNKAVPDGFQAANNARFMGLRGPMMLHGWGYDVDGYPVPNSSGDIQYGEDGSPVTDAEGGIIYKNQTQLADGSWTDPYPEQAFAKNWASAPNTWPVGPVDLRWNNQAKVWTVGTSYDDVYVTLENDLKDDTPVRAVLTDAADGNNPLPDGFRKLVFVQDPNGFFSAPRGSTVYAKYNTDSGFYNPIFNNTTVTSGVINAESSATVYIKKAQYDVGFINPLQVGINIGSAAIFMFIDGEWVVQASSC
jgi:hypothetical protein